MRRKRSRLLRIVRVRSRRALGRLDRKTPDGLRWVLPFGTSLTVHAIVLVLLAVYVRANAGNGQTNVIEADFPSQLSEDLTSLQKSDHSGDPFAPPNPTETPSLALNPADDDPKGIINQPELPPSFLLGPQVQRVPPADLGALAVKPIKGMSRASVSTAPLMAPFSGRQGPARARLVRREGGTVESEKAVDIGLDWLARHQRSDGGWSLDPHAQCAERPCPPGEAMKSDTAAVGLALLPMLGAGFIHTEPGKYRDNVDRGLNWLITRQKSDGDLYMGGNFNAHMYSHAIATMALCEAYGISQDRKLREPAQRAVDFIIRTQNASDGGWRYAPGQAGDTSVFGWQMFALRSATLADLGVSKRVFKGCRFYLDAAATDKSRSTYAYQPGRPPSPVMTAEALLGRQYLGWPRDFPALVKGMGAVSSDLESSQERNIYYWYYATQVLHNMQGPAWDRWNRRVRDGLVSMQVAGNGCDRGSWNPEYPQVDRWGRTAGRHYTTALSLLTLEVYYRYLPLYQARDRDPADVAREPAKGRR